MNAVSGEAYAGHQTGQLVTERALDELLYESARTRVARLWLPGGVGSVICKEPLGSGSRQRLRHETAILERLAGVEGVPRLTAALSVPGAMVLEDVGGVPMAGAVAAGGLDVAALVDVALGLVDVIASVHRCGVVHKDINPANILGRGAGLRPMLIDFDRATTFAEERPNFTHQSEIAGTLAYLAPEQTGRMGRPVDQRADLYALGATLYALATGRPPFGYGDSLQLIHDHLARVPDPPVVVNPALPPVLSDIIMRLLEKEPDQRYQGAEGLAHDLIRLRAGQSVDGYPRFPLGERDFPLRLSPPSRLVGRERETAALRAAFHDALRGQTRAVLVPGAPGVGKTALIDELRPIVTTAGGWFVAGKFDQYRQDAASDAVSQTMRALSRLLLAEPEAELAEHRLRILGALGPNAGLAAAMSPELASVLSVSPQLPTGDPLEIEGRLVQAGLDLLRAVASPERPVAMVLDDLQWAAPTPIGFVDAVVTDKKLQGILLVGAYRASEVDATHPLSVMLPRWERLGVVPRVLPLRNLPLADLRALLAEMLRLRPEQATGLANVIGEHTGGNPYDTVELINALRRDGALKPGPTGWTWDDVTVRHHVGQSDVVDVLAARIDRLPPPAGMLLEFMACLGGQVQLGLLQVASGLSAHEVEDRLAPSLEDGLLVMEGSATTDAAVADSAVRFRHDRVQEAAYGRLERGQRVRLHLMIARRLMEFPGRQIEAAEQYLPAVNEVHDPDECRRVVAVFHRAAANVRLINYPLAERFLAAALSLLEPVETAADAELLVALETDRHATLYGLGNLDTADEVYRSIERRNPDPLSLVDAACVQVNSLTNRGRPADAVALGLDLLERLGLTGSSDGGGETASGPTALSRWISGADELCDARLPDAHEPRILGLAKLLNKIQAPAFFADSMTYARLSLISQRLLVEHGPCADLVSSLGTTPVVIMGLWEDYTTAYRTARQLLAVGEARGYESATPLVRFVFGGFCVHWFERLEGGIEHVERAREALLHGGDLQTACFTYLTSVPALLDCAPTLESCAAEVESGLSLAARTGNDHVTASILPYRQLLRALRGETAAPGDFGDSSFDEAAHLASVSVNPIASAFFHLNRAVLAAVFGDGVGLHRHSGAVLPLLAHVPGFSWTVLAHLLRALALAERARAAVPSDRAAVVTELDARRDWLARRAMDAPANFAHLLSLIEAERAWATADLWGAASAFDRAIRGVQPRQRPWHHALIAERAALFHLSQGNEHAGRALLVEARRSYESWGATGKVDELARAHRFLRSSDGPWRELGGPRGTPTVSADSIDLLAVVEASRALSSETSLDRLRSRVVEVLTAMTGATSVQVVLYEGDRQEWFLPSPTEAGQASVSVDEAGALGLVPLTVFRYAERTRAPLLVADATDDDRFARDPYVAGLDRCSLLVVPILTQGEPRAMLILENRLSSGVFTADRLDAVTLIAGQLAVSLNNALVYQSLEQQVAKRTEALAAANQRLQLLSITDTLTGLANRRCLEERSEAEWQLALQSQSRLAAAMIDIDHFKLYNDHYGHVAGDECLRRVAGALRRSIRGTDLVARYGGEEFVIILPDTDVDGAYLVAERARTAVAALGEPHARAASGLVSVSVGIAAILPVSGATVEQLFKSADAQLYRAKRDGRNQVYGRFTD